MKEKLQEKLKDNKRIVSAVIIILTLVVIIGCSLSWFYYAKETSVIGIKGSVEFVDFYFDGGRGTAEEPYEINTPEQLANLAWLQYLGLFNQDTDHDGYTNQIYFKLTNDIDMADYGAIPPIGTSKNPFIGNFNGNGKTITNLAVDNKISSTGIEHYPLIVVPSEFNNDEENTKIIGMFGVVGGISDRNYGYTFNGLNVNKVYGFDINTVNVKTNTDETLIGAVAGYVNGEIEGVSASNVNVQLGRDGIGTLNGFDNLSDYTMVGYCTDAYKGSADIQNVDIQKPELNISRIDATEEGNAWGGSIDMYSMYNRLRYMRSNGQPISYVTSQVVKRYVDGTEEILSSNQTNSAAFRNYHWEDENGNETAGAASFSAHTDATIDDYMYLYGYDNIAYTKTVTGTLYGYDTRYGYIISDGTHFLNATATGVESGTNPIEAGRWLFSSNNGGSMSIFIDETQYYLNRSGSALTLEPTSNTVWAINDNRITTVGENMETYYLTHKDGGWTLETASGEYVNITDGTNYLNVSNGSIANNPGTTTPTNWYFEGTTTGYKFYTYVSGNKRYLDYTINDNTATLRLSNTTNRSWTYANGMFYSGDYCLILQNNIWSLKRQEVKYALYSGDYFLVLDIVNNEPVFSAVLGELDENGDIIVPNEAACWNSNVTGRLSTTINGQTWYLKYTSDGSAVTATTSSSSIETWNVVTGRYSRIYTTTGSWLQTRHYLYYDEGQGIWTTSDRQQNGVGFEEKMESLPMLYLIAGDLGEVATLVLANTEVNVPTETLFTIEENSSYTTPDTYIPLNAEGQEAYYIAKQANTGYIISGSTYISGNWPYKSGDIRVSQYGISNISGSYSNRRFTNIYTIDGNGHRVIPENNTLVKYEESREAFLEILGNSGNYVYGLHFMNAAISADDCAILPYALINGEEKFNLQMPRDSIDCTLKERGYINFFAGNYFPDNESFFSLSQIFRDEDDNIIDIKGISKVYQTVDDELVYQYNDGTYSNGNTSSNGMTMAFDLAWIGNQGTNVSGNGNRIFYFEVPALPGEYALGSVEGSDGAYLLYLDIAANAQEVKRQDIKNVTKTTTYSYQYPKGVQLVDATSSYGVNGDVDSVATIIPSGTGSTTVGLIRTDENNVSVTGTNQAGYIASTIDLKNGGTSLTAQAAETFVRKEMVETQLDYNTTKHTTDTMVTTVVEEGLLGEAPTRISFEQTINGEVTSAEDDGRIIPELDTIISYQYAFDADTNVINTATINEWTLDQGFVDIPHEDYPLIGEPPVLITAQYARNYTINLETNRTLNVFEKYINANYGATLQGTNFVENTIKVVNP